MMNFSSFQLIENEENSGDDSDDKVIVAMGILNTIESILTVVGESREIMAQVEPLILQLIGIHIYVPIVLACNIVFFKEYFYLIFSGGMVISFSKTVTYLLSSMVDVFMLMIEH